MSRRKRWFAALAGRMLVLLVAMSSLTDVVMAADQTASGNSMAADTESDVRTTGTDEDEYDEEALARQSDTVQSNQDTKWPQGPQVSADGAALIDADTGVLLYGKNPDKKLYPASITKMMTAILAYENLDLDDTVTFSASAVNGIDRDSSNIGIDIGETLSVYDCLRGMLISSANEVALALAEKISGSETKFADLMNKKAKELGCTNTNFVTPNGLQDSNHYTTAHDMALIGKAFFDIPTLAAISDIQNYIIEPSDGQPDEIPLYSMNKFLTGEKKYKGIIGSKTGFTSQARQTLVTCCKRDGIRLIAVVLKEESPTQYDDTMQLFDYGFKNFTHLHAADYETKYSLAGAGFMRQGSDIFGKSTAPFTVSSGDYLTIPNGTNWDDLTSSIVYENSKETDASGNTDAKYTTRGEKIVGTVSYTYSKTNVGTANIIYSGDVKKSDMDSGTEGSTASSAEGMTASTEAAASVEPSDSASSFENTEIRNAATERAGSMGKIRGFFYRILHTGTNGTLYLDVPLLLFVIILIAVVFIIVEVIRSYMDYLKRMRRRKRRGRVHREENIQHGSAENRTAPKKRNRY